MGDPLGSPRVAPPFLILSPIFCRGTYNYTRRSVYPVILLLLLIYLGLVLILGIFVTKFRDVMGIIERITKFNVLSL